MIFPILCTGTMLMQVMWQQNYLWCLAFPFVLQAILWVAQNLPNF